MRVHARVIICAIITWPKSEGLTRLRANSYEEKQRDGGGVRADYKTERDKWNYLSTFSPLALPSLFFSFSFASYLAICSSFIESNVVAICDSVIILDVIR